MSLDISSSLDTITRDTPALRQPARVCAAALTHVGCVRRENQDAFIVDDRGTFVIVADGMGGHRGGSLAAALATEACASVLEDHRLADAESCPEVLSAAFAAAARAVHRRARRDWIYKDMGTTLVAAMVSGDGQLVFGHVGDSRLYRARLGGLEQLTRDHTVASDLRFSGAMSEAQLQRHPQLEHVLSRAIGVGVPSAPDIDMTTVSAGDVFLMCSDGLCGYVDHHAIADTMVCGQSPAAMARELVDEALAMGGPDNITSVVFRFAD